MISRAIQGDQHHNKSAYEFLTDDFNPTITNEQNIQQKSSKLVREGNKQLKICAQIFGIATLTSFNTDISSWKPIQSLNSYDNRIVRNVSNCIYN